MLTSSCSQWGAAAAGVTEAVLADPGLNDRQRAVLLDVYESFVGTPAVTAPKVPAPAKATTARKRVTARRASPKRVSPQAQAPQQSQPKKQSPQPSNKENKS